MKSNLKSFSVTVGLLLMLVGVAIVTWTMLSAADVAVAVEQIQPSYQIAAQP